MTKNEIVLMGKIYLIFNPSQFLWDTSVKIKKNENHPISNYLMLFYPNH